MNLISRQTLGKSQDKLDIESVFASKGQTKVLHQLILHGEMAISKIGASIQLTHALTQQHLRALVNLGLVQETRFGRIRIFRLVEEDPRVMKLKDLVDFWKSWRPKRDVRPLDVKTAKMADIYTPGRRA